jgi:SAP domain-containing ribonucleoprotein
MRHLETRLWGMRQLESSSPNIIIASSAQPNSRYSVWSQVSNLLRAPRDIQRPTSSIQRANMSDYGKLKNAELETLLKDRGLPHTGKKAEMVARLQEDDTQKPSAANEDEIDWDDETAEAKETTSSAPAQAAPTTASDAPEQSTTTAAVAAAPAADQADASTEVQAEESDATAQQPAEEHKEPVDFSVGLASTTIDEELEKRKARAKRFGLPEDDETTKALERAKKFGESGGPKGLNEALPERIDKRRRDGRDDGGRRDFKRRGGRGGRRFDGRGGGGGGGGGDRDRRVQGPTASSNGSGNSSWMGEKDRLAAQERKKKWATAS